MNDFVDSMETWDFGFEVRTDPDDKISVFVDPMDRDYSAASIAISADDAVRFASALLGASMAIRECNAPSRDPYNPDRITEIAGLLDDVAETEVDASVSEDFFIVKHRLKDNFNVSYRIQRKEMKMNANVPKLRDLMEMRIAVAREEMANP